jgi:hypothetical protein
MSGKCHAEIAILKYVEASGLDVIAVGAGNGYCPAGVEAIEDAGGLAAWRPGDRSEATAVTDTRLRWLSADLADRQGQLGRKAPAGGSGRL